MAHGKGGTCRTVFDEKKRLVRSVWRRNCLPIRVPRKVREDAMGPMRQIDFRLPVKARKFLSMLFWLAAVGSPAFAQTAAETAGATAVSSGVAANAKSVQMPQIPTGSAGGAPSPGGPTAAYIMTRATSAATVDGNRRALEAKAGPDAARLLVRSTPSSAQMWINGQPVGNTPLLLIIPPGKYRIELRGNRQETGSKDLALLPKETREVSVKLELHYPTRVVTAH